MPEYDSLAKTIVDAIKVQDHFYDDVWCVANGKLRDRSLKLYEVLGDKRICNTVSYATKSLVEKLSVEKLAEMAKYYREKYSELNPEKVETVD